MNTTLNVNVVLAAAVPIASPIGARQAIYYYVACNLSIRFLCGGEDEKEIVASQMRSSYAIENMACKCV